MTIEKVLVEVGMANVTADKFADYMADYRTVQSEVRIDEGVSSMRFRHHSTGELIGLVDYWPDGVKDYWIFTTVKSPKVVYGVDSHGCRYEKEVAENE